MQANVADFYLSRNYSARGYQDQATAASAVQPIPNYHNLNYPTPAVKSTADFTENLVTFFTLPLLTHIENLAQMAYQQLNQQPLPLQPQTNSATSSTTVNTHVNALESPSNQQAPMPDTKFYLTNSQWWQKVDQYLAEKGVWVALNPFDSPDIPLSPANLQLYNAHQGYHAMGNSAGVVVKESATGAFSLNEVNAGKPAKRGHYYNDALVVIYDPLENAKQQQYSSNQDDALKTE